jgi:hypothetical protein
MEVYIAVYQVTGLRKLEAKAIWERTCIAVGLFLFVYNKKTAENTGFSAV